ncbi:MAG: plasmid stabilization protein [Odoribacter sp.]|nr:plasmid stabilization protein [Odoribacter sp.]
MIIEYDKSFLKSIVKIRDSELNSKIENLIIEIENSPTVNKIKNTKKLIGYKNYYRTRIGDYRLGFELITSITIRLIIFAHRKDIYRVFP